ncbi:uncharacterized protein LOC116013215 [Ipomoea triloba]|uniref:uncharacterized protein LOC116013215 n=1 Tax=Ipomoea triloba TaxID=35885 RepID=UPI00125D2F1B|nr:uncharacterized protein LOC116013215 [Ipomoea triloba]
MYVDNKANEDDEFGDRLDEMLRDVGEEFINWSNELDELLSDSKLPLWPVGNGWSDKSFTALLEILKDMLPNGNELPKSTYDAKKILCPMGMGYKKIHASPNDCILFRHDYKDLHTCPICGASYYKTREKVANKNLTWDADQRISDGKLRHPTDSPQWITFDNSFPEFGHESRNLRFGLCTDAYGNLSGYSVKGHKACPICEDNTCYHQLVHCRKTVYMGYRRFLDKFHSYRRLKKAFNGVQNYTDAPQPLTGNQVYERVEGINVTFGKTQKLKSQKGKRSKSNVEIPTNEKSPWKKKSIFFDLPYWNTLDVRHSIDVMHVDRNVCDSLVGTLLDIKGKTKDGLNARLDLVEMCIRPTLAPCRGDKKTYLPPAAHTLS